MTVAGCEVKFLSGFLPKIAIEGQYSLSLRFPVNPTANWGPKMRAGRPMPGGGMEKRGMTKKQRTEAGK